MRVALRVCIGTSHISPGCLVACSVFWVFCFLVCFGCLFVACHVIEILLV